MTSTIDDYNNIEIYVHVKLCVHLKVCNIYETRGSSILTPTSHIEIDHHTCLVKIFNLKLSYLFGHCSTQSLY